MRLTRVSRSSDSRVKDPDPSLEELGLQSQRPRPSLEELGLQNQDPDPRSQTPNSRLKTQDSRLQTQDSRLKTLDSYPGIQKSIDRIGACVDEHVGYRYGKYASLSELIVALVDTVDQQSSDPRPGKDPLGYYCSRQQHPELKPYDGHYRDHPIL